jgi:hypothetical protein
LLGPNQPIVMTPRILVLLLVNRTEEM